MFRFFGAMLVAAVWPSVATAQTITLAPESPTRWDVAFTVGWLGGNKSPIGPGWNDWYDSASVDAGVGYHLTRHVKLDVGVGAATEAAMTIVEPTPQIVSPYPYYRTREHRFRPTSVMGGVTYQFLENAWFHPLIGAGVAVIHERERAGAQAGQLVLSDPRDPQSRVLLPALPNIDTATTTAHPYGLIGFKTYASERVFFRTDLRITASKAGARSAEWRAGFGIDF